MQLATATDDPVHTAVHKRSHFDFRDGRKFQVHDEADVSFGPGCQAMLPGSSGEKCRGVYWLPCSVTEPSDGVPLCPNTKAARLAPPVSMPDPDATPVQLDESEEACKPKHKTPPT